MHRSAMTAWETKVRVVYNIDPIAVCESHGSILIATISVEKDYAAENHVNAWLFHCQREDNHIVKIVQFDFFQATADNRDSHKNLLGRLRFADDIMVRFTSCTYPRTNQALPSRYK
jgi:hypothetical protein